MSFNRTIESLDLDAIRRGDKNATADAISFLRDVLDDEQRQRRKGDRANANRAEWLVLAISPASALNNYDVEDAGAIRFEGSTSVNATGLLAPSGGAARLVLLYVLGTGTITLKHEHADSEAPNRIVTQAAGDVAIATGRAVALHYHSTRWRELKWM